MSGQILTTDGADICDKKPKETHVSTDFDIMGTLFELFI